MIQILLFLVWLPMLGIFTLYFAIKNHKDKSEQVKKEQEFIQARKEFGEHIAEDFQRIGWTEWPANAHLMDEQLVRMKRAMSSTHMKFLGYDRSWPCIYVQGDGSEGYRIDKHHCFCPDFDKRGLPCKHMYFVVFNLVGEHPDEDIVCTQKTFADMPGWDQWDPDIHKNPEQFVRLRLSMVDDGLSVMCYDSKYKLAKVLDMSYASKGKIYLTGHDHCDCEDFRERQFPCKHMYALAAALNGDAGKCILDHEHLPLHGIKFTLVGHFPKKSKDYIGVREELARLCGTFNNELPYYAASAILLGDNPSEKRQAMIKESGLEVFTLESVRKIFSGDEIQ